MPDELFLKYCRVCGSRVADHLANAWHPSLGEDPGPESHLFRYDCDVCGPGQLATAFFNITCMDCGRCGKMQPLRDPFCSRCGARRDPPTSPI